VENVPTYRESFERQADLLQIVAALGPSSRFACRVNRRNQQGDQDADDPDDYQKLNERESVSIASTFSW
jgi:hypothetical protein